MVKRKPGALTVPLADGLDLTVDVKKQKIATCGDLRKYLGSVCTHELLDIWGQQLQVSLTGYSLSTALKSSDQASICSVGIQHRIWKALSLPKHPYQEGGHSQDKTCSSLYGLY